MEEEDNLPLVFNDAIPDDSMVINVKYNLEEGQDVDDINYYDIKKYVLDLGCDILFSTAGLHLKGENKKPHIHYSFITTSFQPPSNPSQHRKRWAKKVDADLQFLETSWKFHHKIDLSKPKYNVLAYPLKEGNMIKVHNWKDLYIYEGVSMTKENIKFLLDYGKTLYDTSLAMRLRQDKCEERKKNALNDLAKLCKDNIDEFGNYNEMVIWLDINYISTLSLEEYPDPRNYKINCQKIAVSLGKLKYSQII